MTMLGGPEEGSANADGVVCKYESALAAHLQHSDPLVRQRAICIIGHVGERAHPSHAQSTVKCLEDEDASVMASAAVALARMGAPGAAALASELQDGRPDVIQQVACEALGRMPNWPLAVPHVAALVGRFQDREHKTRCAAVEAVCRLLEMGPQQVLEARPTLLKELVGRLSDQQASVRAAAATALAHMDAIGGAGALGKFLQEQKRVAVDPDGEGSNRALTVHATLSGLGRCSESTVVEWIEAIVLRLQDPSSAVRAAAEDALRNMGPECASAMAHRLVQDESPVIRELLATGLGWVGAPHAVPFAEALLGRLEAVAEPEPMVQVAAALAVGRLGPDAGEAAGTALANFLLLAEEGPAGAKQRHAAAHGLASLGEVGARAMVPALSMHGGEVKSLALEICIHVGADAGSMASHLAQCAEDADEAVRERATQALGMLGSQASAEAIHALGNRITDQSLGVSRLAIAGVGHMGPAAMELAQKVLTQLQCFDVDLRRTTAWSLGQLGPGLPTPVTKALAEALKEDKDSTVRELSARALGSQGAAAIPFAQTLGAALQDQVPAVQVAAVQSLSLLGGQAVAHLIPAICNLALASQGEVEQEALLALGSFGQHGVYTLASRLEDHVPETRQQVLEALAKLAHYKATQELIVSVTQLLKDKPNPGVRAAAAKALGEIAASQLEQARAEGLADQEVADASSPYSYSKKPSPEDQAQKASEQLARLVDEDFSAQVRTAALTALRRVMPLQKSISKSQIEVATSQITSQNPEMRKSVLLALGDLGVDALPCVGAMVARLGEEFGPETDVTVQRAAAEALGKLGEIAAPEAAQALATRILRKGPSLGTGGSPTEAKNLCSAAVAALLSLAEHTAFPGPRRVNDANGWKLPHLPAEQGEEMEMDGHMADQEEVQKQRRHYAQQRYAEECETRQVFAAALGMMGQAGAGLLVECMEYPDPDRQEMIIQALMKIPASMTPQVGKALSVFLESGYTKLRQAAMHFLQAFGEAGVAEATLVPHLTDDDPFIRRQITMALGTLESVAAPTAPAVALRLRDPFHSVRSSAVDALRLMGAAGAAALAEKLEDESEGLRQAVCEGLGHLAEVASPYVDALVLRLGDVEAVRLEAELALQRVGSASPPCLAHFIQTGASTREVQFLAIHALGLFGEAAAHFAPVLAGFVGCGVDILEETAAEALHRMGPAGAAAIAAVLAAPSPPVHVSDENPQQVQAAQLQRRRAAAQALGELGEANSKAQTGLLAHCLSEADKELKMKAGTALTKLGLSGSQALCSILAATAESAQAQTKALAIDCLVKMDPAYIGPFADSIAECMEDPAPEVRRSAAQAFAVLGSSGFVVPQHAMRLSTGLRDGDALVRKRCAEALGKLGTGAQDYAEDLAEMLRGADSWTWAAAAEALRLIGVASLAHAAALGPRLSDPTSSVRYAATVALGKLGEAAKDQLWPLVGLISSPDASMRCTAVQTLCSMGKAATPACGSLLKFKLDKDAKVREKIAIALGMLGKTAQEADALADWLIGDSDPSVRQAAINGLQELGQLATKHADKIAKHLTDNNARVRSAAAQCLVSFGPLGAQVLVARLVRSLEDPEDMALSASQPALRAVLEALQGLDSHHLDPYAELLAAFYAAAQPDLQTVAWACLQKVGQSGQMQLAKLHNDPHVAVRAGVAEALGQLLSINKKSAQPTAAHVTICGAIAEQLLDTSTVVRAKAAEAIGRIGGRIAEPHVADLARRLEEHDVRIYRSVLEALAALGELSDPYARLVAVRLEAAEAHVRGCAASSIGRMSGSAGLAYVQNLAFCLREDRDQDVRRRAAEAIGLMAQNPQAAAVINQMGQTETLASRMLEDKSAAVRQTCAESLGRFGQWAGAATHQLSLALHDSAPEVRKAAAQSMACLGEALAPEVVALIRALEDLVEGSGTDV